MDACSDSAIQEVVVMAGSGTDDDVSTRSTDGAGGSDHSCLATEASAGRHERRAKREAPAILSRRVPSTSFAQITTKA